jgi:hypothetical protein
MKHLSLAILLSAALLQPAHGLPQAVDPPPPAGNAAGTVTAAGAPATVTESAVATTSTTAASAPAAPGSAAPGPAATTSTTAAAPPVVCRTMRVTGSRLRKERVCSSRSTTDDAQDWLKRQQENGANRGSGADVNGG